MRPAIYLISGIPGAGKTTVSRPLAARFDRGAHLEGDVIGDMVVSGKVLPAETPELDYPAPQHLVVDYLARSFALLAAIERHG